MSIGFIGVGLMGGPLARNLIRAGKDVLVFDLSTDAVKRTLDAGTSGKAAGSLGDLGGCDMVFTSLPMPQHVEGVMLGEGGLLNKMNSGAVHVELSTIDPQTSVKLRDAAQEKGIGFIQCTLGKTPAHAEKAEEPLFIGGDKALYEKLSDIWPIIGSPAYYMGGVEASCAVKLISNMVGMANLAVLAEGMRAGEKAGIEKKVLVELLQDTGARSFQMDVRGPWIAAGDFNNRFGLDLALKDVRLGCEMARSWGLDLKTMEAALELYKQASSAGHGKEDCNAVYKVIGS
ncbi:MAG: NAD(P)-dependent oxidoreductase [Desulfofustis sp.]|jgi:3-hydroxyisobutyrate dehydrogenase-like beta-hydroxyacid dehydrogenase|nr:NAD(P)-dependent oxidoreductase [Desulfofustis sp.]